MYEGHFHLERRPFAATPDPSCCYLSPPMTVQFHNIATCAEQGRGIAILTGPAGIGKTLLSQVLLTELQSRLTGVYLGTGQFATRRAFLQAILYELGQPYGGMSDQELRLELSTALKSLIAQKDGLLLVLDEAHLLSDRLLEEVRLLADLSVHGVPLVRVVLCGNPEFEERLTAPALTAFNQRVACHESIETLLRSESVDYLSYRVEWAGGDIARLFEPGALQLIVDASDGVPRCLNQLADHSLTQAFRAGATIATETMVRDSLAVLQSLPLRWNASALLSRSWDSKTEAEALKVNVESPASAPLNNAGENATQIDENHEIEEEAACCFEFGAGESSLFESTSGQSRSLPTHSEQYDVIEIEEEPVPTGVVSVNSRETESPDTVVFETSETIEFPSELKELVCDNPDEDADRPIFPWLTHPAAHSDPLASQDPRQSSEAHDSSNFSNLLNFQVRSLDKARELRPSEAKGSQVTETVNPRDAGLHRRIDSKCHIDSTSDSELLKTQAVNTSWGEPVEEVIVDRYAALDANTRIVRSKSVPNIVAQSTNQNDPTDTIEHLTDTLAVQATDHAEVATPVNQFVAQPVAESEGAIPEDSPEDEFQPVEDLAGHPMEQIDSICALIETDNEGSGTGVELVTDWGVERIDVDLSAELEPKPNVESDSTFYFEIDGFLGTTIFDVGRGVRQSQVKAEQESGPASDSTHEVPVTHPETQMDVYERNAEYDIVVPDERADSSSGSGSGEDFSRLETIANEERADSRSVNDRETTHSRFHNLFSALRRRKLPVDAFLGERQKVAPIDS